MDKKQNNLEWSNVNNNLITDFTPPKRLSGYLLTPREPTASRSLVCEEDLEDTKNEFENPRQKLKHYLLCGKKFYIRKSNGSVTADTPQDEFVVIPPGKVSIMPNSDDDKKNENGNLIFSDDNIKKTINKTIQNFGSEKQYGIKSDCENDLQRSNEISNILKNASNCLIKEYDLQKLQKILCQMEDFELRFPQIASLLVEPYNRDNHIRLRIEILKARLLWPGVIPKKGKSDCGDNPIKIPKGGLI